MNLGKHVYGLPIKVSNTIYTFKTINSFDDEAYKEHNFIENTFIIEKRSYSDIVMKNLFNLGQEWIKQK